MMEKSNRQCGFITILGAPNVGKSTLVNFIIGSKISIVSSKVQTTRTRVLGVTIVGKTQMVFIDTPGIFEPKRRLDRAMVNAAWGGARDSDNILLLIDSHRGIDSDTKSIINQLEQRKLNKLDLALNKVDLVNKKDLLGLSDKLSERGIFDEIFMISALKGEGVSEMIAHFRSQMPQGPWLFPEDQISTMPLRMLAAEITREKLYNKLHQELPYVSTVETESWKENNDGSIHIHQVIYVTQESQRSIILGKGGRMIKSIGIESRRELAEIIETEIHLFLFVKVRQKWDDDPARYGVWGLDYDS